MKFKLKIAADVGSVPLSKDPLEEVLEGTYKTYYHDKNAAPLADIVVPRLDELSIEQLSDILETYGHEDNSLFPSGWRHKGQTELYPRELALALSKSNCAEDLTDLYNIYYKAYACNPDIFWQAEDVWQKGALTTDRFTTRDYLDALEDDVDGWLSNLEKHYPEFVEKLRQQFNLSDSSDNDLIND